MGSPLLQHSLQPGRDQEVLPRCGAGFDPGADVAVRRHGGEHGRPGVDGVVRRDQELAHLGEDDGRVCRGGAVANRPHAVSAGMWCEEAGGGWDWVGEGWCLVLASGDLLSFIFFLSLREALDAIVITVITTGAAALFFIAVGAR